MSEYKIVTRKFCLPIELPKCHLTPEQLEDLEQVSKSLEHELIAKLLYPERDREVVPVIRPAWKPYPLLR